MKLSTFRTLFSLSSIVLFGLSAALLGGCASDESSADEDVGAAAQAVTVCDWNCATHATENLSWVAGSWDDDSLSSEATGRVSAGTHTFLYQDTDDDAHMQGIAKLYFEGDAANSYYLASFSAPDGGYLFVFKRSRTLVGQNGEIVWSKRLDTKLDPTHPTSIWGKWDHPAMIDTMKTANGSQIAYVVVNNYWGSGDDDKTGILFLDVSNPLSPKKFPTVLQGNDVGIWNEPDVAAITRNPSGTSWILAVGDVENARMQTYVVPASSWNPNDPGKTWLAGADSTTNDPFVSTTYSGQGNRYLCGDDYNGYKNGYCKYVYSQKEANLYWICMGGKDASGGTADNRLWGRVVSTTTGLPLDGDSNALDHAEASDPDAWRGVVGESEDDCSFRAGASIFIDNAGALRMVCSEKKFSKSLGNLQIDELWRP